VKRAAERGLHAQDGEVLRRDDLCAQPFRRAGADDRSRLFGEAGDLDDVAGPPLIVREVGGRHGDPLRRAGRPKRGLGAGLPHRDDPVRIRVRQRPQHDGVDQREDRRVDADAERERQHGRGGEAG
jgi:hypothetical protein